MIFFYIFRVLFYPILVCFLLNTFFDYIVLFSIRPFQIAPSIGVEQVLAWAPVTQRARVRSPVGTSFLGEIFRGFSSPVRQMSGSFRPQGPRISSGHHNHPSSFITGANDLRCSRALKTSNIHTYRLLQFFSMRLNSEDWGGVLTTFEPLNTNQILTLHVLS